MAMLMKIILNAMCRIVSLFSKATIYETFITIAILCYISIALFAQENHYMKSNNMTTLLKAEGGLHGLGLTFEPAVAKNFTIDFTVSAGNGYNISENTFAYKFLFNQPAFSFAVTPKLFYNLSKRAAQGKRTDMNAGNYIGFRAKLSGPSDFGYDDALLANVHWGLQRALGERWLLNAHAGLGYAMNFDGEGSPYPALEFKFSYVILKKTAVPWKSRNK